MIRTRTLFLRLSAGIAPFIAALAMSGPAVVQAAAPPIIVDDGSPADDCGKHSGKTAQTDVVTAINNAPSGRTVLICPGEYTLTGGMTITGKKLTIKRALTGEGSRPILKIDPAASAGIDITTSTVTLDGLVLDAISNTQTNYTGVSLIQSSATIKNSAIIGPNQISTTGVLADATGQPKVLKVSITNSHIAGYSDNGVLVQGLVKLTVSSSHLDGTDGGRVMSGAFGVFFNGGPTLGVRPTGTVTRSKIIHNDTAVMIGEVDKVSVSKNTLIDNAFGVYIIVGDLVHSANNNKVTGNTILGVPASGVGVYVNDIGVPAFTIKNTTISKNTIVAAQYTPGGVLPTGIQVEANAPAATLVTATITGNTLLGFPPTRRIVNVSDFAGLKIKGNDALP